MTLLPIRAGRPGLRWWTLMLLLALWLLPGCGIKGPLYLPGEEPQPHADAQREETAHGPGAAARPGE